MSVKQNTGGRWVVRYRDSAGSNRSKTFTLKRDAESYERSRKLEVERGVDVAAKGLTIQDLIRVWWPSVERSVKSRSADRYNDHVRVITRHPISKLPLERVDYAAAQGFVDDLSVEYAPKTVEGVYGVFGLIMSDAAKRGKVLRAIPKPVMPKRVKPKLIIPTREQVERLVDASDARVCAAVMLAGFCGLRQGELLALQRADVDIQKQTIFVHQARNKKTGAFESTKTESTRTVYLPQKTVAIVSEHLDEYEGATLFPVTASIFDKSWRQALKTAEIAGVRFHDLRHAAASMMIHAGLNINQVAYQLGHANPNETLKTYAHLWPNSMSDAMVKMNQYLDHD